MWVLPAAMIAGGVMNAAGQLQSAQATTRAAKLASQDAIESQALTEIQKRKQTESAIGEQKAGYAASGVNTDTGSPLVVMMDSLANSELDINIDKMNTQKQVRDYQNASRNAIRQGTIGAISTLLTTGATARYFGGKSRIGQ